MLRCAKLALPFFASLMLPLSQARAQLVDELRVGMATVPTPRDGVRSSAAGRGVALIVPQRQPESRSRLVEYVIAGMSVGMALGAVYGAYDALDCDSCWPGAEIFVVLGGTFAGGAYGALGGAIAWIVVRPPAPAQSLEAPTNVPDP